MEKFFKIGEISKLYHIGVDSLRYYEEIGVISPERSESGYRLYSVNDIWKLNVIRELRELGYSMDSIRQYLECHTVESTLELLDAEQKAIEEKMEKLKKLRHNVRQRMATIEEAQQGPFDEIRLEQFPVRRCYSISEGYSDDHEMDVLIKRLLNLNKRHFYVIGNNQIGTVISRKRFKEKKQLKYQSVFIMDPQGPQKLPAGDYLTVSYRGDYQKSADWAERLLKYAAENGRKPAGELLEILWIDIHTTSEVQEQITELQLRVE